MRVRPFVWILLGAVCLGVLIFAARVPATRSLPLQARIEQIITNTSRPAQLRLRLTDAEGVPVDQASVRPQASMPSMSMVSPLASVHPLGQGLYLATLDLSMAGAWKIDILASADGFEPLRQSLVVMVGQVTIITSDAARQIHQHSPV